MATERTEMDRRLRAQGAVLRAWREALDLSQQRLGRSAGYGSDTSPKSAAVAISRIEAGKTDPHRNLPNILKALGRTPEELEAAINHELHARPKRGPAYRALVGNVAVVNETRRAKITEDSERLDRELAFELQKADWVLRRVETEFVQPFLKTATRIDWQIDRPDALASDPPGQTAAERIRYVRSQTQASVLWEVARSAAGGVAGAGLGAGAATGIFALVSAAATASTGTAIASLSGAAATSATLAWLGGGSLATGGMGVAGGTAVIGGIVALPAVIAMGGVLAWKGRQLRRQAQEDAALIKADEELLERLQSAFPEASARSQAQGDRLERASALGHRLHTRLVEPALAQLGDTDERTPKDDLPAPVSAALDLELKLVSLILDMRALPVWLSFTSIAAPERASDQQDTSTTSLEWIDASLELADQELADHASAVTRLIGPDD